MVKTDENENRGGVRPGSGRPAEKEQLPVMGEQSPPKMPKGMGEHAEKVWQLAVESLPHVLRPLDEPLLRLCCEAYQLAMESVASGDSKTAITAMGKYEQIANKIGLTPHSRRVIKPVPTKEEESTSDPFELWKKRTGKG